jgi:hypothetical protein
MNSKILVRVLIVILAALLIYRIHQRVETYRIPRENCRTHMSELAEANLNYMYQNEGMPAPSLDSLASWAGLPDSILLCPSLRAEGFTDSLYFYDPKLALGTQFAISCPNHDRHGGVIGGLIEKDFPDSLFTEADWEETFFRAPFPQYAHMRMVDVSRSALVRVGEEEAAYLASRYPAVMEPSPVEELGMNIHELVDPLGGEYFFETVVDTVYTFYEHPDRRGRARGDSVQVTTYRFVAYASSNPDTSRVEVFYHHPLTLPSWADGAVSGMNDRLVIIKYWNRSLLGSLIRDEREVDLLDVPRWEFLQGLDQEPE